MHFLAFSVQWNDEIKSIRVHKHIYIYVRNQYKAIFMHVNCVFLKRCINETGISLFDSDSLHDLLDNKIRKGGGEVPANSSRIQMR